MLPPDEPPARTRTVTWSDPMLGAAAAPTMSGLDYLQAVIWGEMPRPPMVVHEGSRVMTAEGKVVDASGRLYAHGTETCLISRPTTPTTPTPPTSPDASAPAG